MSDIGLEALSRALATGALRVLTELYLGTYLLTYFPTYLLTYLLTYLPTYLLTYLLLTGE